MTNLPDFREIARRAELEFHVRPHRFRRRAWLAGVLLAILCCGWLLSAGWQGDRRIYEAGPVSSAHTFIANDCRQCHISWQPLRRILGDHSARSVTNEACLKCHQADEHQSRQVPAHAELSCAMCHREHRGQMTLAAVSDQQCQRCHQNLQTADGGPSLFASSITGFAESQGHPEFNLQRRLRDSSVASNLLQPQVLEATHHDAPQKHVTRASGTTASLTALYRDVLKPRTTASGAASDQLGDRSVIRFNHAAHLVPQGLPDAQGQIVHLAGNCQVCHTTDASGTLMQPINYRTHCATCHPLLFDNERYPGAVVPHEQPSIVRGFLTERYTLMVLQGGELPKPSEPVRPLPGKSADGSLTVDQTQRLEQLIVQAENRVRDQQRNLTRQGGCRLCHTVTMTDEPGPEKSGRLANWQIVAPDIPERWMPHSRFDHGAHRMLTCLACHEAAATSKLTEDVLLPGIATCRQCHQSDAVRSSVRDVTSQDGQRSEMHLLQSGCVTCHTYHQRSKPVKTGDLTVNLQPGQTASITATATTNTANTNTASTAEASTATTIESGKAAHSQ